MGKTVQIISCRRPRPNVLRVEVDRSLSGSGHELFEHVPDASADRTVDNLARALFGTQLVRRVHIFSNIITVEMEMADESRATMDESEKEAQVQMAIAQLFVHYRPGVMPTPV